MTEKELKEKIEKIIRNIPDEMLDDWDANITLGAVKRELKELLEE